MVLGAFVALACLGDRLPLQNLVGLALTILLTSMGIELVGVRSGFPFGHHPFPQALAYRLAGEIPWPLPFAWVCLVATSRGAAQEILRPWRGHPGHGFRVLGCAAVLVTVLASGLQSFGTVSRAYPEPGLVVPCAGWLLSSLAVLALAFPWWIDKRPVTPGPERLSLAMWFLLGVLFATASARVGRRPALVIALAAVALFIPTVLCPALWSRFRGNHPHSQTVDR